jgi:hypothetical protein
MRPPWLFLGRESVGTLLARLLRSLGVSGKKPLRCGPPGRAEPWALAACSPYRRSMGHPRPSLASAVGVEVIGMKRWRVKLCPQ